jgi:hypothetical protein
MWCNIVRMLQYCIRLIQSSHFVKICSKALKAKKCSVSYIKVYFVSHTECSLCQLKYHSGNVVQGNKVSALWELTRKHKHTVRAKRCGTHSYDWALKSLFELLLVLQADSFLQHSRPKFCKHSFSHTCYYNFCPLHCFLSLLSFFFFLSWSWFLSTYSL